MNYRIEVLFNETEKENIIYDDKSYYTEMLYDHITISNRKIIIHGSRSKNIPIESILTNTTSTLYKQILKALVFAYMSTGKGYQISEIKLCKNINGEEVSFVEHNIVQPYINPLNKEYCINTSSLQALFSNSSKIDILLNSMILFIKGFQENNFDYYWKAFNSLYTGISGEDKEFEKLKFMREFIEINQSSFSNSLNLMDKDEKDDIRSLRIRDFILNNFPTRNETKQFKEFIVRFTDYRLNQMFAEVLPYRQEFLSLEGLLFSVQSHIEFHKAQGLKYNEQLLCFYILKYSYYLRNKYFHAEKTSPVFILKSNNELTELDKINEIMCTFIVDMFNCSHLYI